MLTPFTLSKLPIRMALAVPTDVCELVFGEDWPNDEEEEDGEGDAGDGAPMP